MIDFNTLKEKFLNASVLEKFIVVNIAVFVLRFILKLAFNDPFSFLELPSNAKDFIFQPWSIFTYSFLHYDFIHLLFNMLWLYFIGQYFLNVFSGRLAVNVYLLGAICGGLLYLFCYNVIPYYAGIDSRLVGASAAVRALMIFICAYMPHTQVRIISFNIKLWHIGAALITIDFVGLFGSNSGGNLAHIGGAALGYFYATQYKKGFDIGSGFGQFVSYVTNLFSRKSTTPFKKVHKNPKKGHIAGFTKEEFNSFTTQKRIDLILDKISKSGYDSLTAEEKEFLFKSGK